MRRQILYIIGSECYLILMDVAEYTSVEDIVDFLNCRDIHDKESLENALNEYVKFHTTNNCCPSWMFDTIDAVIGIA